MLRKLGFRDLISAVQTNISQNTGIVCYDVIPENTQGAYCSVLRMTKEQKGAKMLFEETFVIHINVCPGIGDGEDIYTLVQKIEESMTQEICLGEDVQLVSQSEKEQTIYIPDGEILLNAELVYKFTVVYPLVRRMKNI